MVKTWEFLLLVFGSMLVCTMVWAASFTTQTGQGYFTWNSQVISYYSFTPGFTFNLVNGVTATDTNGTPNEAINQAAFNAYICSQNPNQC